MDKCTGFPGVRIGVGHSNPTTNPYPRSGLADKPQVMAAGSGAALQLFLLGVILLSDGWSALSAPSTQPVSALCHPFHNLMFEKSSSLLLSHSLSAGSYLLVIRTGTQLMQVTEPILYMTPAPQGLIECWMLQCWTFAYKSCHSKHIFPATICNKYFALKFLSKSYAGPPNSPSSFISPPNRLINPVPVPQVFPPSSILSATSYIKWFKSDRPHATRPNVDGRDSSVEMGLGITMLNQR